MNNPIYILTHEVTVLKMRYYELLEKHNKMQNDYQTLQNACSTKEGTYKNTLLYLQNANVELNKMLIEKNQEVL
jgi:hypothetical protein